MEYVKTRESGVFFDVGANYGIHSYRLLSQGYRCVLFEPQTECVAFIEKVCALNGWSPLIVQKVVGERSGTVTFYQSESTWFSSRNSNWVVACGERPEEVRKDAVTLDAFCQARGEFPDLIKIDVEGGEPQVLQGAQECLRLYPTTVVAEVWKHSGNREPMWESTVPHGHSVFALQRNGFVEIAGKDEFLLSDSSDFVFTADQRLHRRLKKIGVTVEGSGGVPVLGSRPLT
jgi:FkbM family methyltransferase